MPHRTLASQHLARLFSVLSHPIRIRIIAELRNGEMCVNSLQEQLGISHSGVSQHLAILRTNKLIKEHKNGRNVYYKIAATGICNWIAQAIPFIVPDDNDSSTLRSAAMQTLNQWSDKNSELSPRQKSQIAG